MPNRTAIASMQRRSFLGLILATGAVSACGVGQADTYTTGAVAKQELLRRHGVEIPEENVKIALLPFGDHMALTLAYKHGWFEEVGIKISNKDATADLDQLQALLINGTYDFITNYIPDQIRNMEAVPAIGFLGVMNNTNGTAILARPKSGFNTVSGEKHGEDWKNEVRHVVGQLSGRRFGMEDVGAHRAFIDTLLNLAGITFRDLDVTTGKDEQLILLANGGKLDFVLPQGGAEEAHLIHQGWYPIVNQQSLVDNLPEGSLKAVQGIGHVGVSFKKEFFQKRKDVALRAASVVFRVIDSIHHDVKRGSLDAAKVEAPILAAGTGTEITPEEVFTIYEEVSRFLPFEEQAKIWVDKDSETYYETIYNPQIESHREAGTLTDPELRADDVAGVTAKLYRTLAGLKDQYEQTAPNIRYLSGESRQLAELAQKHYRNRNYLDATRILAAVPRK